MDEIPIAAIGEKAKDTLRQETRRFLEIDREVNQAFLFGFMAGGLLGIAVGYALHELEIPQEVETARQFSYEDVAEDIKARLRTALQ